MSWIGRGEFRQLLHKMVDKPRTMVIDERRYWISECGSACVHAEVDLDETPSCTSCFPDGIPEDYFTHGEGAHPAPANPQGTPAEEPGA